MNGIEQLLTNGTIEQKKSFFAFDNTDEDKEVIFRFNLWARLFFPQFFKTEDAPFHKDFDFNNLLAYRAKIKTFTNLAFRGSSKSTRTKLFITFCIANDIEHFRRYIKILSHDQTNCKQFVTDIYNLFIQPQMREMYPEIFTKTDTKREETMTSFTTATGVKVLADTVGSSQRGAIQDENRPDFIIFDDFETRETLRSAIKTKTIWDNMQEAKDGLSINGACIYLGNYISETGNVQRIIEKKDKLNVVLITPIIKDGVITWNAYTKEEVEYLKSSSDDFAGEYLQSPDASKDVYFDRDTLDRMEVKQPIKEIAGFKIYREYDPSHRFALGADVAGGVGLDSSASVIIDFDTYPAQVVGTFHSNTIQPEAFGDEIYNQGNHFGGCLLAPENNRFEQTILKAKMLGGHLYMSGGRAVKSGYQQPTIYGWRTDSLTKSQMMSGLKKAIDDGMLALNDLELIQEAKSYTRNNLIDREPDARLTTRHYDILTACAIAWQMKDKASHNKPKDMYSLIRQSKMASSDNPAL